MLAQVVPTDWAATGVSGMILGALLYLMGKWILPIVTQTLTLLARNEIILTRVERLIDKMEKHLDVELWEETKDV